MPRHARLDAAGVLHHVIIRGIARKEIFLGDDDREDFAGRLSVLLPEIGTACYAWALMPNHVHMLLRRGDVPLSTFMARGSQGTSPRKQETSFPQYPSRHFM